MSNQTTIQKKNSLRYGSTRLEIGTTLSSLVDIGALRGVSLEQLGEVTSIKFDNVPEIKMAKDQDKFAVKAELAEINFTNLALMSGGIITVTNNAGSPVSDDTQVFSQTEWEFDKVVELNGQNSDGTAPNIDSVTGSVDGATTDFKLVKLQNGNWAVSINSGGSITTEAQDITVQYDYTPSASKEITFKSKAVLEDRYMRLVNTNQDGKTITKTFKGVANVEPLNISFAPDDENEVATTPISLEGYIIKGVDAQQTT
jgi:hypothetical protein